MTHALRPRTLVLFVGDICFFIFALWLSLFARSFELPTEQLFFDHLLPFTILFVAWVVVFFIAGLYESRSIILERRRISVTLLAAQVANIIIAALFFFFIPFFGITPKTLLVIYLVISVALVFLWRVAFFPLLYQKTEKTIVVGEGTEVGELVHALNEASRAPAQIVEVISPSAGSVARSIKNAVAKHSPRFVIADFTNPAVSAAFPELYNYLAKGISFIDAMALYEEVFGRVPLSLINDEWIARNVSRYSHTLYDVFKRMMDIVIAFVGGILSLVLYPFVALAILLNSGMPIFIAQVRVGEDGRPIRIYKFRSMARNETDLRKGMEGNYVTAVGVFLRATRIDELPQLWSILRGDLSLIGPRPELPSGVELYEKEIPYYGMRSLIKPGLSGWAQLYQDNHPHHGEAVEATKEKLSYDLYYLKHRSLLLDLTIALKTIKKMLTRSGA